MIINLPLLGVCGGDNGTCLGCDGVPNSGKLRDSCGVCGGNGSTCTNITSIHPSLLPSYSSSGRTVNVVGAGLSGSLVKCFADGAESMGMFIQDALAEVSSQKSCEVEIFGKISDRYFLHFSH